MAKDNLNDLLDIFKDSATPEQLAKLSTIFKESAKEKTPREQKGVKTEEDKIFTVRHIFKCHFCGHESVTLHQSAWNKDSIYEVRTCNECPKRLLEWRKEDIIFKAMTLLHELHDVQSKRETTKWRWARNVETEHDSRGTGEVQSVKETFEYEESTAGREDISPEDLNKEFGDELLPEGWDSPEGTKLVD